MTQKTDKGINMRIIKVVLVIFGVMTFWLSPVWGEDSIVASDSKARVEWIQNALDDGAGRAKLWQYGWIGVYGIATIVEGVNAENNENEDDERFDSTVNAVTSAIGVAALVVDPLVSYSVAEKLKDMSELDEAELKVKLVAGEKLLALSAKRQERGRSWETHALAGLLSVLAGVAVACDDRNDDGLVMFASTMLVSEIQIFTMPTKSIDDWANYKKQKFTKNRKNRLNRLYVGVIPGGLKFKYLF